MDDINLIVFHKLGLEFIRKNTERLLKDEHHHLPRWLAIVFPAMVELAESIGLDVLTEELKESLSDVFNKRQQILEMEELIDDYHNPPLLSYLEALQSKCDIDPEVIVRNLSKDGSLFQSPSATACAFMATGERKCKNYLQSLVRRCPHGGSFCWIMHREDILAHMENNSENYTSAMISLYRATDVMFSGEYELKEARSISKKLLQKSMMTKILRTEEDSVVMIPNLREVVEHEFSHPWIARMEHLDHKFWIEANNIDTLWVAKASFYK
ncbi:geranyllinalool synthase [Sarracenia purpurea var. burkii]